MKRATTSSATDRSSLLSSPSSSSPSEEKGVKISLLLHPFISLRTFRRKFGSYPSVFILPLPDLIHQGHGIAEHCFGLDSNLSVHRIGSKWPVVHHDFSEFFQCVLSTALLLDCVHFRSKALSRPFPSHVSCVSMHS